MSDRHQSPEFTPDFFFTTVNSYYRTAAVKAGIQLGLFDVVDGEGKSIAEIAQACHASTRAMRILCRFLASIGFLKTSNDLFFMTREMALYLGRKSPGYLGDSIDFLLSPYIVDAFRDLASVVRTGKVGLSDGGITSPNHPQWVEFARVMAPSMALPALLVAELADGEASQPLKVVDVAAGHGLFGLAIAQRNPNATVTLIDWGNVLQLARDNAANAHVLDRVEFRAGDAFDVDFGRDQDVIILANFLHHFDEAACDKILKKAHAALRDGGRVLTVEFIVNEDRTSPTIAAEFSMMMLGTTLGGEAWAYSDLERMLRRTGYGEVKLQAIPPAMEQVILATKAPAQRAQRQIGELSNVRQTVRL